MFLRYIQIAFRNLRRQRLFAFINIAGLALSMTVCLMVLKSTKKNFSYDKFHPAASRTWRITSQATTQEGKHYHMASSPLPLATVLRQDYAIAEEVVRLYSVLSGTVLEGKKKLPVQGTFTEPSFFHVFGFRLKSGDPATALSAPNSIVLSEATAGRIFGNTPAMGKVVHFERLGDYIVTGIMAPSPGLSHIDYDAYASLSSVPALEQQGILPGRLTDWNQVQDGYTYVKLKPDVSTSSLATALTFISQRFYQPAAKGIGSIRLEQQSLGSISPSHELYNDIGSAPPWGKVLAEIAVALGLLICACFNYTNLSIVRSLQRAREVGVRKVNGALRWQVFMQFITESVVMCMLSLVLAVLLLILAENYTSVGIGFLSGEPVDFALFGWFLVFSLLTGILAGIIPAWALSSFQPAKVLRNMVDIKLFGGLGLRKTLIVIQFTLSLTAIIFFVTVYRQFAYKEDFNMGFSRDNILDVPLADADFQLMKDRMMQVKGVEAITASSGVLGVPRHSGFLQVKTETNGNRMQIGYYAGDADFLKIMQLKLLAGSNFPATMSREHEQYIIVNEQMVKSLNLKSPSDAIGKTIWLSDSSMVSIIGVIKDFNYQPIEAPIFPMAIRFVPGEFKQLQILVNTKDKETLMAGIKTAWLEMHPGETFSAEWMSDLLHEKTSGKEPVSAVAILVLMITVIAALGLLGVVSYTTFTRRREIGVRKVMGAGVSGLVLLLSRNYLRLILLAGLIALPLGYLGSQLFLRIFANRVSIGFFTLAGSFAVLLCIALLAIISQTWRAASSNPVDVLRND
ncbi:FtsX-like permease family protein [Chitinophaga varians]|uniref:FtsX-like permease family protein n=1 Tax=Chitinophaga varians TaxID=2202339 RepID=A0A847RQJ9_9BACT|nr:ABC transporter permease [Chitinophaga varians]NLR65172.1 FtsX-like permease family protein [Chitinophaga varians]